MELLRTSWEKINTSFWFLPSILVTGSVVISFVLLTVDGRYAFQIERSLIGLFSGAADAARVLLSTIAGSLITVISIAYSITIVALQQASTQYSPRLLRNFSKDKGNQAVLGTYLATFIYALLVLRSVRDGSGAIPEFVPALSITFGLVLTLVCIGLLIYFISHIASTLEIESIIKGIHNDLVGQIDTLFPEELGVEAGAEISGADLYARLKDGCETSEIKARESGFVRAINSRPLAKLADATIPVVFIRAMIGDFVRRGETVIEASVRRQNAGAQAEDLVNAVIIDYQRSVDQDPLFAINQLVDVALKALSPSVNDPTTAEHCLFQLTDALCRLASREFPSNERRFEGNPTIFIFSSPGWPEFVDGTFSQIRRTTEDNVHVTGVLIEQLAKLARCAPAGNRLEAVTGQLIEIKKNIARQGFSERDAASLTARIDTALS